MKNLRDIVVAVLPGIMSNPITKETRCNMGSVNGRVADVERCVELAMEVAKEVIKQTEDEV